MIDPQRVANEIRECVSDSDTVRRLKIEILSAAGNLERLTVRARHRDRVLSMTRSGEWWRQPPNGLALGLAQELVAEVLAPLPGVADAAVPARPRRYLRPRAG